MCSFISCACRHRWKWLLWVEVLHCNLTTYTAFREYVCTAREHKSLQDFIIFYPLQNELVTCDTLVTHSTTLKAIYQPQRWLWPPSLARWLAGSLAACFRTRRTTCRPSMSKWGEHLIRDGQIVTIAHVLKFILCQRSHFIIIAMSFIKYPPFHSFANNLFCSGPTAPPDDQTNYLMTFKNGLKVILRTTC